MLHDRELTQSCKPCPCRTSSFHVYLSFIVTKTVINHLEKHLMFGWLNQEGPNATVFRQLNHACTVQQLESEEPEPQLCTFNQSYMLYIYSSFAVFIYGMTTKVLFNHIVGRLSIHVKSSHYQHHKTICSVCV